MSEDALWEMINKANDNVEALRKEIKNLKKALLIEMQENQILKDGVKALKYGNDWDFIEYDDHTLVNFDDIYFRFTKEDANKIKTILDLVEVKEE